MFPPTLYGILLYICTYNARGCTFTYTVYVYATCIHFFSRIKRGGCIASVCVCMFACLAVCRCMYLYMERERVFFSFFKCFFPSSLPYFSEMFFFLVCMYMYVCMYVCIYDCIHVCVAIHVCMHTHICKVDR